MINTVNRIAKLIYPIRKALVLLSVGALVTAIYTVLSGNKGLDPYLLPCIALFGWLCCLYGLATGFSGEPLSIGENDRFFTRIKKRVKMMVAWVLAAFVVACMLGLFYLSYMTFKMAV